MQTENTSLLTGTTRNNRRSKKAIRLFKNFLYYLMGSLIFGESLKVGLDVYLESWQYDIQNVGDKDFDTQTISTIGTYLALTGALLGYILYRQLHNADINRKINYIIYKITQAVAAWGLHAYLIKLFLFTVTESCTSAYHSGHAYNCTTGPDEPLPLSTFCCVDAANTKDFNRPVISLNELAFITSAIISMESIWYAMKVFRYEFFKQSWLKKSSNVLSVIAASASYAITKFAIKKLPTLYYTVIPLVFYHGFHFITSIPTIVTPVTHNDERPLVILEPRNNISYRNGIVASILSGFSGAALLHSGVLTLELQAFPYNSLRQLVIHAGAATAGLAMTYQVIISRSPKDFLNKVLARFLPKPLLIKMHCLPEQETQPEQARLPIMQQESEGVEQQANIQQAADTEQPIVEQTQNIQQANTRSISAINNFEKKRLAAILSSAAVTFIIADIALYYMINAIPTGRPTEIMNSWEARWLRFGFAIAGLLTYSANTYGEELDLDNELRVDWPSFTDIATFIVMSISLIKAIQTDNRANQIAASFLLLVLFTLCLLGNKISRWLTNLCTPNEVRVLAPPDATTTQSSWRNRCDIRGWFNNWCCSFRAPTAHNTTQTQQQNIPNIPQAITGPSTVVPPPRTENPQP